MHASQALLSRIIGSVRAITQRVDPFATSRWPVVLKYSDGEFHCPLDQAFASIQINECLALAWVVSVAVGLVGPSA